MIRRTLLVLFGLLATERAFAADPPPVVLVPGKFGKALDARKAPIHFDGDDRYRRPPLTVECWAKLFSKKGANVLVASDARDSARHWEIRSDAGTGAFVAFLPGTDAGEIKSDVDICDGKWHYLSTSYDGTTARLFVDGNRVKSQAVKPKDGLKPKDGPLTIGQAFLGDRRVGCDGLIDDVRISRAARTIDGMPLKELPWDPETVGLWRFDRPDNLLTGDPLWTPPPPTGPAADWEKRTDKDWIDGRLRLMDTGPTWNATFDYPTWQGKAKVYKGTAIRIGDHGEAAVLFDRGQLRMACGWTGKYLNHSDRRFGLLNTPTSAGDVVFACPIGPAWGDEDRKHPLTAPLPANLAQYKGMYVHGNRVVLWYRVGKTDILESPWVEHDGPLTMISREVEIQPTEDRLPFAPVDWADSQKINFHNADFGEIPYYVTRGDGLWRAVATSRDDINPAFPGRRGLHFVLPPSKHARAFRVIYAEGLEEVGPSFEDFLSFAKKPRNPPDLRPLVKPGPPRWTETLTTRLEVGASNGPFAVDTLTLPYDNPYKALFFVTGLDFMPNGDIAICTAHGDVWLARVDEKARTVRWKRFATGLYQPLGLKVVDGKIIVLERGQLTRLHDRDGKGEADFYECLSNSWHTGAGEHSFDTCLETNRDGNFYFFKTGDTDTPTGGCLLRVGKDGGKAEIFATGFRHPIGLGISPDGLITGADQEGNWMPMTRIDVYRKGGFYGDMRAHHRETPPKTYDPPLLWLPKEADNSAGGQVWVPKTQWGPLSGQMLHLSYGRCKMYLVMPQKVGDVMQAGAVDLGLTFLSGTMRGRFGPDGNLYVCGLNGWQTAAKADGCLQRVRYTGKPLTVPVALAVHENGVRLTFAEEMDRKSAEDVSKYRVEVCNYRWSGEYGSKHWSVADPKKEGHDAVAVESVTVSADGKSVFLHMKEVKPVMQMFIGYDLKTAAGAKASGTVYNTIHKPALALRN